MRKHGRKFGSSDEDNEQMALQITSMADIFTIILVFLLKTLSTSMSTVVPANGMTLPNVTASSQEETKEGLKLEIVADAVLVDQKPILKLNRFFFPGFENLSRNPASEDGNAESAGPDPISEPLVQALAQQKKKGGVDEAASNLLVMADERTPYSTLRTIMASAATAGYLDLQLLVIKAE